MFNLKFEPDIPLLTVVRNKTWSLSTVVEYEAALRPALTELQRCPGKSAFIIDVRASGAQPPEVANALRSMVERLGPLQAQRVAVVTSSGLAKLQAKRTNADAEVFTSMVLARDWITRRPIPVIGAAVVQDAPSDAEAEGVAVHVHGPADLDVTFSPSAALETAKRITDAANEAQRKTERSGSSAAK